MPLKVPRQSFCGVPRIGLRRGGVLLWCVRLATHKQYALSKNHREILLGNGGGGSEFCAYGLDNGKL